MVSAAPASPAAPADHDYDGIGVGALKPRWERWEPRAADGSRSGRIALAPGRIHLWAMDLARVRDAAGMALLGAAELARGERLRDRARRAMYLGGRVGLRLLLRAYTGIANAELRFGYGERGKPALLNPLPGGELGFNYTLSGNRALYALAWNRRVGIDLETLPRKINAARLARRKLAAVEQRSWRAVPVHRREVAMLACWTRKEAYGKALGVGIRYAINQAPVFVGIESPVWQCAVRGLFDAPDTPDGAEGAGGANGADGAGAGAVHEGRILHGLQIAPPFPGIAALVHDGGALVAPAEGDSLQAWQWVGAADGSAGGGR